MLDTRRMLRDARDRGWRTKTVAKALKMDGHWTRDRNEEQFSLRVFKDTRPSQAFVPDSGLEDTGQGPSVV